MIQWSGQKVLITGAGGFIGSHLTERLVHLGARTRALVHYNSTNSWGWLERSSVKSDVEIYMGDVRDRDSVSQAIQGMDIIFHLAALIAIPYSYQAPVSYVQTNIEGTLNVLQAARDAGVNRVVHTSTSEVYGTPRYVPIDENHPLQGQSPYSAAKIGADKLVEAFYCSFGLPVTTIRPFNTYGPRQSSRAVIPTIVTQVLTQPEISLGNLTSTRDFNYVLDTVAGFIRIAELPDASGQVFNVGTGKEISIGELAHTILDIMGRDRPIISRPQRMRPQNSEVERLCADTSKIRKVSDWQPQYSLRDGLYQTIQWLEQNLEHYKPTIYTI